MKALIKKKILLIGDGLRKNLIKYLRMLYLLEMSGNEKFCNFGLFFSMKDTWYLICTGSRSFFRGFS